jgi:predicted GNAT family N-acyltransferase
MDYEVRIFSKNDPEYDLALALRYKILRKPLGMQFTESELAKDDTDVHLGLFDEDGTIAACLILQKAEDRRLKMRQVAVDDNLQGKGLGSQLNTAAENYARKKGYKVMFCHARKTAVPFYQKQGYSIIGDEFTEVNIPHYVMEKAL